MYGRRQPWHSQMLNVKKARPKRETRKLFSLTRLQHLWIILYEHHEPDQLYHRNSYSWIRDTTFHRKIYCSKYPWKPYFLRKQFHSKRTRFFTVFPWIFLKPVKAWMESILHKFPPKFTAQFSRHRKIARQRRCHVFWGRYLSLHQDVNNDHHNRQKLRRLDDNRERRTLYSPCWSKGVRLRECKWCIVFIMGLISTTGQFHTKLRWYPCLLASSAMKAQC